MSHSLQLLRIDTRQANVRQILADLRHRLSPQGNVVSEAGRQRTIEVFGELLSPQQVVERICTDVANKVCLRCSIIRLALIKPSSRPKPSA